MLRHPRRVKNAASNYPIRGKPETEIRKLADYPLTVLRRTVRARPRISLADERRKTRQRNNANISRLKMSYHYVGSSIAKITPMVETCSLPAPRRITMRLSERGVALPPKVAALSQSSTPPWLTDRRDPRSLERLLDVGGITETYQDNCFRSVINVEEEAVV